MKFLITTVLMFVSTSSFGVSKANSVVYGEPGRSENFDPYTPHEASARRLSDLIFDSLITLSKSGDYIAHLANAWKVGEGNTFVDIILKKDVRWHDSKFGNSKTFSADDVLKTVSLITNPESEIPNQEIFASISSAEKLSPYSVRIRFRRAVRDPLRYLMFKILPSHVLADVNALKRDQQFSKQPIGTGPFQFVSMTDTGEVVLKASGSYFKGEPEIKELTMKAYADQSIMAKSLMFNALDLVAYISPRDLDEVLGDRNLTVTPYDALSFTFIGMNSDRGILKDKRVRHAIAKAINRDEMLQAFFQGRGQQISGPFPPTSWAYNLEVPITKFDQGEAKNLLRQVGLLDNDKNGILESRTGTEIKLLFAVPLAGESEIVKRISLALQDYLRKVGLQVELQFMDWSVWKKRVLGERDYDLTIASWSFDDANNISSLFHSSNAIPYGNNFVNFKNPEVDSMLTEANVTSDFDKRRAIYHALHAKLAEEAPYAYLWTLMHHAAHNSRLSNVEVSPFSFFRYVMNWRVKND